MQKLDIRSSYSFISDISFLGLANGISAAVGVFQLIVVARIVGPAELGVATLIVAYPNLFVSLVGGQTSVVITKYLTEFHVNGFPDQAAALFKWIYSVNVVSVLLIAITVVLASRIIIDSFGNPENATIYLYVYLTGLLPLMIGGTAKSALGVSRRFRTIAVIEVCAAIFRLSLVIMLVMLGMKAGGIVTGLTAVNWATGIALFLFAHFLTKERWGSSWITAPYSGLLSKRSEVMRYLLVTRATIILGTVVKQIDVIIIGGALGTSQVGYFRIAKSTAAVIGLIVGPLQAVSLQNMSELVAQGQRSRVFATIQRQFVPIGVLAAVMVLGIIAIVPWLLPFLVGNEYRPAIGATRLLLAANAVWLGFFWLRPAYYMIDEVGLWLKILSVTASLTLVGYWIGVSSAGMVGIAWVQFIVAGVFGHLLAATLLFRVVRRRQSDGDPEV
jgi:O-antigen/teichoic acid export membrane protein